jgi:amidase
MAGPDERQWETPPVALTPAPERPLNELRFAWSDDFGVSISSEISAALRELAEKLRGLGCRVERCNPPDFDFAQALQVYGILKQAAFSVRKSPLGLPRFAWRMVGGWASSSNPTRRGLLRGAGATLQIYAAALSQRDLFITKLERFLADWDAWLCPVAALPAYPHLQTRTIFEQLRAKVEVDGRPMPYLLATSAFTAPFNLTGGPVVVLPMARSKDGLPIGVQVAGKRWSDMQLLNTAGQLSQVTGPFRRPPGY